MARPMPATTPKTRHVTGRIRPLHPRTDVFKKSRMPTF